MCRTWCRGIKHAARPTRRNIPGLVGVRFLCPVRCEALRNLAPGRIFRDAQSGAKCRDIWEPVLLIYRFVFSRLPVLWIYSFCAVRRIFFTQCSILDLRCPKVTVEFSKSDVSAFRSAVLYIFFEVYLTSNVFKIRDSRAQCSTCAKCRTFNSHRGILNTKCVRHSMFNSVCSLCCVFDV